MSVLLRRIRHSESENNGRIRYDGISKVVSPNRLVRKDDGW